MDKVLHELVLVQYFFTGNKNVSNKGMPQYQDTKTALFKPFYSYNNVYVEHFPPFVYLIWYKLVD